MKDFTTRVETTDQELHIHLPEGFGPGAYEVVVTPLEEHSQKKDYASNIDEWSQFVKTLNLTPPQPDWKFDREEANQRGNG